MLRTVAQHFQNSVYSGNTKLILFVLIQSTELVKYNYAIPTQAADLHDKCHLSTTSAQTISSTQAQGCDAGGVREKHHMREQCHHQLFWYSCCPKQKQSKRVGYWPNSVSYVESCRVPGTVAGCLCYTFALFWYITRMLTNQNVSLLMSPVLRFLPLHSLCLPNSTVLLNRKF